jgi:uncharacterized protein YkwD
VLALPDVKAKLAEHGIDLPTTPTADDPGAAPPPPNTGDGGGGGGGGGATTGPPGSIQGDALDAHNAARAQYGAGPMSWDPALEAAAKEWSERCVFEHSKGAVGPYGENLGAGAGTGSYTCARRLRRPLFRVQRVRSYGVKDAVAAWMDEAKDYDWSDASFSMATGHFTQVCYASGSRGRPTVLTVVLIGVAHRSCGKPR